MILQIVSSAAFQNTTLKMTCWLKAMQLMMIICCLEIGERLLMGLLPDANPENIRESLVCAEVGKVQSLMLCYVGWLGTKFHILGLV